MEKTFFTFGKNWVDYVNKALDREKIERAKESLLKYLLEEEYKNKTFIDVGCGSGIFSLSALCLGCKKVISFDIDPLSIKVTKLVKEKFSSLIPKKNNDWEIFEGNILDDELVKKLKGQGDIVYSWGVLHHTGKMRQAIENAVKLVKPNGFFIIAIYNKTSSSDSWLKIKKFYNIAPMIMRKIMVYSVFLYLFTQRLASFIKRKLFKQPTQSLFCQERGMSIFYDVIDWLGGYPYEYASFDEIVSFIEPFGFSIIKAPTKSPSLKKKFSNRFSFMYTGNNEFVFKKNETN